MGYDFVLHLAQETFLLALMLAGPPLAAGLVVGVTVSVVQAVTQVNEMTLAFVPKIAAILTALLVSLPWALPKAVAFMTRMIELVGQKGVM